MLHPICPAFIPQDGRFLLGIRKRLGPVENISTKGPQNCRSLGFARDDKKERVVIRRGSLPRDRALVKR
jgi:hypothetical protein